MLKKILEIQAKLGSANNLSDRDLEIFEAPWYELCGFKTAEAAMKQFASRNSEVRIFNSL